MKCESRFTGEKKTKIKAAIKNEKTSGKNLNLKRQLYNRRKIKKEE
jgi:hypothetical protein